MSGSDGSGVETRRHRVPAWAALVLAVVAAAGSAQGPQPVPERKDASTPAAAVERTEIKAPPGEPLAPLSWLEGCWRANVGTREFDERWMAPRDNAMTGSSQTQIEGKTLSHEDLRLDARPEGVFYAITPSGRKEMTFRLVEQTLDRSDGRSDEIFVFADPANDFPQKITYRRASQGWLYAMIEGKVEGQDRQVTYPMRRVDCESGEFIRH